MAKSWARSTFLNLDPPMDKPLAEQKLNVLVWLLTSTHIVSAGIAAFCVAFLKRKKKWNRHRSKNIKMEIKKKKKLIENSNILKMIIMMMMM